MRNYTTKSFDYSRDFSTIDFRLHPELYQIGRGEQGVLMVEPYKSEILPSWKFRTPDIALVSAKKIFSLFKKYKKEHDFVGMDMARKFLQMGYTRARRYANHASGKKYVSNPQLESTPDKEKVTRKKLIPQSKDWATNEKAESARIYYEYYKKAANDTKYGEMKKEHMVKYSQ